MQANCFKLQQFQTGIGLSILFETCKLHLFAALALSAALIHALNHAFFKSLHFCDPQSPWQRGTNENTNRLLRQYLPRGTDLSIISQAQLDQISLRLNQRPRKTLDFQTPASRLQAGVASID